MTHQTTLAHVEFAHKKQITRRETFLSLANAVIGARARATA